MTNGQLAVTILTCVILLLGVAVYFCEKSLDKQRDEINKTIQQIEDVIKENNVAITNLRSKVHRRLIDDDFSMIE